MATMKFNKPIPTNGDAKTIVDIPTANIPTPIDNDLEPFDICLDDAPSIILAIPANNRPTPSKITKNPVAYSGKARTAALNPMTRAPKMMFPTLEDFDWTGENPVTILSIPITIRAAASDIDTVATPTVGYIITESASPMATTPRPICTNLSHDGWRLFNCPFASINFITLAINIRRAHCTAYTAHVNRTVSKIK